MADMTPYRTAPEWRWWWREAIERRSSWPGQVSVGLLIASVMVMAAMDGAATGMRRRAKELDDRHAFTIHAPPSSPDVIRPAVGWLGMNHSFKSRWSTPATMVTVGNDPDTGAYVTVVGADGQCTKWRPNEPESAWRGENCNESDGGK